MSETKEVRYDTAIELRQKGNLNAAMEALEQLCVDFPDYALPHATLSMMYCRDGNFEKSLHHAAIVCELEPEDPFSFVAMSSLAIRSGDREMAEEALGKARMAQLQYMQKQRQEEENQA